MNSLPILFKRLLLVVFFLAVVNIASGYLAVTLGYPSLWGNTTGIFAEYAIPLNFNWAFAHLLSMLPLAGVAAALPSWKRSHLVKLRWVLLAALVVLFFVEVKLPYGRLNHIPFALFLVVDCLTMLALSLLFHPPWRVMAAVIGMAVISLLAAYLLTSVDWSSESPNPAEPVQSEAPKGFFEEIEWTQKHDHMELFLLIRDTVGPDLEPTRETICEESRAVAETSSNQPVKVLFMVHPWFESTQKYVYHAGSASLDSQLVWQCDFIYPTPDA